MVHARDLEAEAEREERAHGEPDPGRPPAPPGEPVRDLTRPPGGDVPDSAPMHRATGRMLEADVYGPAVVSEGGRLPGVVTVGDVLATVLGGWREGRGKLPADAGNRWGGLACPDIEDPGPPARRPGLPSDFT